MGEDIRLPGAETVWHYQFIARYLGPFVFRLLGGWHVSGREHIPATGPALICSNHVSYLDPPVLGVAMGRRTCYMAKEALFRIPVLGWCIRRWYAYPVDLDEGGRKAIRIATRLLQAGELVVIFPEGTRSPDGELIAGQPGAMFIAARARVPIIPAAVWGTDIVLPRHAKRIYRCPIYVRYGAPMMPPEAPQGQRPSREQLEAATRELMARIAQLQREIKAQVPAKWLERAERLKARWRRARLQEAVDHETTTT